MHERPKHLTPSELGTQEYWNKYYQNDIDNAEEQDDTRDITQLESWFEDVNAPAKVLDYLTGETFPLSPNKSDRNLTAPSVLDLGTGNGSSLFELKLEGGYSGSMCGIDYSQQSVELATSLWRKYVEETDVDETEAPLTREDCMFARVDILRDDPTESTIKWWKHDGFNLVLDKGTFDAISLSSEEIDGRKAFELYPAKVASWVAVEGFLMVTSCNWTEEELIAWFTKGDGVEGVLQVYGKVKYPTYEFGGKKGQGVASVCFRKLDTSLNGV